MSARLLHWPLGLVPTAFDVPEGPRTAGAGGSYTYGNYAQTVISPSGLWHVRITLPPLQGDEARHVQGWMTALHAGANATRVPWFQPNRQSRETSGLSGSMRQPWTNGEGWSNRYHWRPDYPSEEMGAAAAKDATIVKLGQTQWGASLSFGQMIGFYPFHLGAYRVTEVFAPGLVRIWPPLRKAVAATDKATLFPVLAMRPLTEMPLSFSGVSMPATSFDLLEVRDPIVRAQFTE